MSALDIIRIKGFKSIRDTEKLSLRHLNVLIGSNGAGKTNFVSVFKLLNNVVEKRLQLFVAQSGGANSFLHFGSKVTSSIEISLNFGQNSYVIELSPSQDDSFVFTKEICYFKSPQYSKPYSENLGAGHKETQLIEEMRRNPGKVANYVFNNLSGWKVYHFHDTSDSAKVKQTGDLNDNAILRADASNLAAFLYWMRETRRDYYELIVKTIRLAAPFFDDFNLRPSPLNNKKIQLEWREKGSDSYFNAHTLSDGTLRFICLSTLLLQPTLPSTILIDEPELGLHPYAITLLANLLQSAAEKTQVIVSTQSVPLVNQFTPEDIIVVDREDGQSVFKQLDKQSTEHWLEEYGLGDLIIGY